MKIFLMVFIVLFLISSPFFAQSISVKRVEEIRTEEPAYYPQFSPDGSKIYFSTENYKGLRELDLNSNSERIITEDFGAGYDFSFSSDGQNIFYRSDNFENPKKRSSIIAFNLISNSQNKIVSNGTEVSTPVFEKDKLFYTINYNPEIYSIESNILTKSTSLMHRPVIKIENQKMAIYLNGEKKILDPVLNGSYFWQSVSPEGNKILFTEARNGTMICDFEGNILLNLGKANFPQWSPDGKWIAYMDDYDNGRYYTASDIFVISSEGKNKFQITSTSDLIEMYPRWSPVSGDKLIVNTDTGKLFSIELNIEERGKK